MFKTKFHITSLFISVLLIHVVLGIYYNGYSPWWISIIILVYILILFLGSVFIRWNFYIRSQLKIPILQVRFEKGNLQLAHNNKKIALTFDDGPAEYTAEILEILKRENVKATFFVIGKNIPGKEQLIKRMQEEGHIIGNHSYEHGRHFDWKSSGEMRNEIERTNVLIEEVTGVQPVYFRPPYGVTNPNLSKAVRLTGMKSIGWNIRSFDTMAKSEAKLLKRINRQLKPGAIILLHDRCAITAKILPELIKNIREKGYELSLI